MVPSWTRQLSDPLQAPKDPTCVPTHSCASGRDRQGWHGLPLWIWSWVSGPLRPRQGLTSYWEILPWAEHRLLCSSLSPGLRHSIALLPPQKVRLRGEQSSYPVDGPFCHHKTGTGDILFNANGALLQKAGPIDGRPLCW